jgi:uncharacterized membrane protein
MDQINWAVAQAIAAAVLALLFVVITRGTRAVLGPRRRLEEELGLGVLKGRLKRGEITREEFDRAASIMSPDVKQTGRE